MSFMPYVSPDQMMKDRSEYAHKGIARGRSVIGMEYADGLLFVAENPSSTLHKISEIYDRIAFAGVGKYSEFEDLRIAGHPPCGPARVLVRTRGRQGSGPGQRVLAVALDHLHAADEAVRGRDPRRRGRRRRVGHDALPRAVRRQRHRRARVHRDRRARGGPDGGVEAAVPGGLGPGDGGARGREDARRAGPARRSPPTTWRPGSSTGPGRTAGSSAGSKTTRSPGSSSSS